jgi:hypothetical protein
MQINIGLLLGSVLLTSPFAYSAGESFGPLPVEIRNQFPSDIVFSPAPPIRGNFAKLTTKGPRPLVSEDVSSNANRLSPQGQQCWNRLLSGASRCYSPAETKNIVNSVNGDTDLLELARNWSVEYGVSMARDLVKEAITAQDITHGGMEARLNRALTDSQYFDPQALAHLTSAQKKRIGIFVDLGFSHDVSTSPNASMVVGMSEAFKAAGFYVELFNTDANMPASASGGVIKDQLQKALPQLDQVIILCLSKGGQEVMDFFLFNYPQMSSEERAKIRSVISLSGVLRDAFMARWLGGPSQLSDGPTRLVVKSLGMSLFGWGDSTYLEALGELGRDPWVGHGPVDAPQLTWVAFAGVPIEPDGVGRYFSTELALPLAIAADPRIGPEDGVVETAGEILPPHSGIKQAVIRVLGSHMYLTNQTVAGHRLIKSYKTIQDAPGDGEEFAKVLLRALPASILDGTLE